MNEYYFKVNFSNGEIDTNLKNLVQNDYKSTKINFTFDKEGRVLFKLLYPDGTFYTTDIVNNELVLDRGVLCKTGYYGIEVSVYSEDTKLTDYATHSFYVRTPLVDTDEIVEPDDRVPILDNLINEVNTLESTVNTNETTRQSNEQTRVSNENTRISNEETRQSNEVAREKYITGLKQDVEDGKFNGEDGYTPVKGVDYYTEAEKEELIDEISSGATSTFNQNVQEKTTAFNNNASLKTDNFNSNAQNKLSEYNSNHTTKLSEYNQNSTDKMSSYNTNATSKVSEYNTNASDKLSAYNTNATEKLGEYNSNHTEKLGAYNDNATEKTTAFNENYQEKLDDFNDNAEELQNKVDHYKKYSNALVKISSSGTELTIDDTAECPMEMELEPSEIEQISYEGYSLYDFMNNEYTIDRPSYMSVTKIENGYTITNTYSDGTRVGFSDVTVDSSKNYVISFDIEFVSGSGEVSIGWYGSSKYMYVGSNGHKAQSFTGITTSYFSIYTPTNSVVNITNLMVYEGTDLTKDYEPYTGGNSSPNPDYPQDIHTITGDNEIKVENKNWFDVIYQVKTQYSTEGNILTDQAYVLLSNNTISISKNNYHHGRKFLNKLKLSAGTYTLSYIPKLSGDNLAMYYSIRDMVNKIDIISSTYLTIINGNRYNFSFTLSEETTISIALIPANGQSGTLTLSEIELEKGLGTIYIPYKGQTFPLTLGNLEYCKIGTYKDEFYKAIKSTNMIGLDTNQYKVDLKAGDKITIKNNSSSSLVLNLYTNYGDTSRNDYWTTDPNASRTITIGYDAKAIAWNSTPNGLAWVNIGQESLNYEPYPDGKWYLKKNTASYTFTGNENWQKSASATTNESFGCITNSILPEPKLRVGVERLPGYFNRGQCGSYLSEYTNAFVYNVNKFHFLKIQKSSIPNWDESLTDSEKVELFKNYLVTVNNYIYYLVETPTYTLLDNTLQTQLDNIYNWLLSYKDQTNISQTNDDLPFIIITSACYDLNKLLTRVETLEAEV